MKKILGLISICLLLCLSLCSCGTKVDDSFQMGSLHQICEHDSRLNYFYDEDTNIIYVLYAHYNKAGLSVYYNSEGKPMTYDEFVEVHMNKYHKEV